MLEPSPAHDLLAHQIVDAAFAVLRQSGRDCRSPYTSNAWFMKSMHWRPADSRCNKVQLMTRLKLSGHQLGLLINFNVALIKFGIKRRANTT